MSSAIPVRLPRLRPAPLLLLGLYATVMGVALALGAYAPLFPGGGLRGGQGIDFFCVPKAFLNLLDGRSAFDTWGGAPYGPHATWFVLHPAVALWPGAYLAWLPPWPAYATWVAVTLGIFILCGVMFARHAGSPGRELLGHAALLCSPVTYWLLFVGNVHGLVVLAGTLLLVGLHELATGSAPALQLSSRGKVAAGLLLSLLSKPVLLVAVPALFVARSLRRPLLTSLGGYAAISLAFLFIPALNPESVGIRRIAQLVVQPEWVRRELNVYAHGFVLIPEMLDNAMHWFHMVAQADNAWDHVQIYSLQALLRGLTASASLGLLRWVAVLPIASSVGLLALRTEEQRLLGAAWVVVLSLVSHFLGYAIAWEYQYTQLLVVVAAFISLPAFRTQHPLAVKVVLAASSLLYLPTPYGWFSAEELNAWQMALVRVFRVGPALVMGLVAFGVLVDLIRCDRIRSEAGPTLPQPH